MSTDELLQHLCELEIALHQQAVRHDRSRLDLLLHDEFTEFGRSRRSYTKADVLKNLAEESSPSVIWSQDFVLARLGEGVALLTYRSAHVGPNGELSRHTLRSSLWQQTGSGWRMRFHQGTPTDAFPKSAKRIV
jgi:hypothetical protein